MKVAILTQPLGKNYGGIIQAWALQRVIKRKGYNPVTINRKFNRTGKLYDFYRSVRRFFLRLTGKKVGIINIYKNNDIIYENTERFIARHLSMSEPLKSTKMLKRHFLKNEYCAVIVGSDQTWRPCYSPNIYNYFLDFISEERMLKIAYASSFGTDQWEFTRQQANACAQLAKGFDAVSVREDSGVKLCKTHLDIDAELVLDPTLLLDILDYQKLISDRLNSKTEGLYTYFLDRDDKIEDFVSRMSKRIKEPVFSCQARHNLRSSTSNVLVDYIMPDVEDWLAGFANSNFVITDSFHGMVFSIVFEKPFLVVINEGRGSARFTSMAKWLGVTDRVIARKDIDDFENLENLLKPAVVDREKMVRKSLDFLDRNLPKI